MINDYTRKIPDDLTPKEEKVRKRVKFFLIIMSALFLTGMTYTKTIKIAQHIKKVYIIQKASDDYYHKMRFKLKEKEYYLRLNLKEDISYKRHKDYYHSDYKGYLHNYRGTYNIYEVGKKDPVAWSWLELDLIKEEKGYSIFYDDESDLKYRIFFLLENLLEEIGYPGFFDDAELLANANVFTYNMKQTEMGPYNLMYTYKKWLVIVQCENMDFDQEEIKYDVTIEDR